MLDMGNIIAAVGVLLSATPTLAGLQIGHCTTELYEVYQGGPLPGEPTVGQTGIPMREGILVVTNPNEFALGTWVTIPSLYGDRKFQVGMSEGDPKSKIVAIWHDDLALAVNSDVPRAKICRVAAPLNLSVE
jgi:hypothetical protein